MPDERMVENMFDRALDAFIRMTHQVSRVAWALEIRIRMDIDKGTFDGVPCTVCGSMLTIVNEMRCSACQYDKENKNG